MKKYLKLIDFFTIGVLLAIGISLIILGIAYDSYLYKIVKPNRTIIRLYNKELLKELNKDNPREIFAALIVNQKYNCMLLQKKYTFITLFLIGLILCIFSMFYAISIITDNLIKELEALKKHIRQKEIQEKIKKSHSH